MPGAPHHPDDAVVIGVIRGLVRAIFGVPGPSLLWPSRRGHESRHLVTNSSSRHAFRFILSGTDRHRIVFAAHPVPIDAQETEIEAQQAEITEQRFNLGETEERRNGGGCRLAALRAASVV